MEDGLGDGYAPLSQKQLLPLPQGDGPGELPHPQLRALQVQDQVGVRAARPPGGGPVDLLQQGGALDQAGVGQIDPQTGHARLEQIIHHIPLGAGVPQSSVKVHRNLPLFGRFFYYEGKASGSQGFPLALFRVFSYNKPEERRDTMRVMAIDYGDAHTGVALSDPTGFLVGTTTTINSWRQEVVVDRLAQLIQEHRPDEVVLGFPKNMDGTDGRKAGLYRELAAELEEVTGMKIVLWDERRTTIDAHQILFNQGKDGRKRKKIVDAMAASLILENYLDFKRMKRE